MERVRERKTWVFDLDNTLYDGEEDLFVQVGERMTMFIGDHLGMDREGSLEMRRDYFHRYGTTLRGLMEVHDVDPEVFMDYVHEIDYGVLREDGLLRDALVLAGERGYRLLIYTNGPKAHADQVLSRVGLEGIFEGIFDIERSDWFPKPREESGEKFLRLMGVRGEEGVMFDDLPWNLVSMAKKGLKTVWVKSEEDGEGFPEVGKGESEMIDYETEDLCQFLREVLG